MNSLHVKIMQEKHGGVHIRIHTKHPRQQSSAKRWFFPQKRHLNKSRAAKDIFHLLGTYCQPEHERVLCDNGFCGAPLFVFRIASRPTFFVKQSRIGSAPFCTCHPCCGLQFQFNLLRKVCKQNIDFKM